MASGHVLAWNRGCQCVVQGKFVLVRQRKMYLYLRSKLLLLLVVVVVMPLLLLLLLLPSLLFSCSHPRSLCLSDLFCKRVGRNLAHNCFQNLRSCCSDDNKFVQAYIMINTETRAWIRDIIGMRVSF